MSFKMSDRISRNHIALQVLRFILQIYIALQVLMLKLNKSTIYSLSDGEAKFLGPQAKNMAADALAPHQ